MPFETGQSGNPGGRSREKLWRNAISRATSKTIEGKVDLTRLDTLAEALIMAAEAGDIVALKEIGDRIDGKPNQSFDVDMNVTAQSHLIVEVYGRTESVERLEITASPEAIASLPDQSH